MKTIFKYAIPALGALALTGCSVGITSEPTEPSPTPTVTVGSAVCYQALLKSEEIIAASREALGISIEVMGQSGISTAAQDRQIDSITSRLEELTPSYTALRNSCEREQEVG